MTGLGLSMPIKQFKPTSAGRRGASGYTFNEITKSRPEKSLIVAKGKTAGRNNRGVITIRHRGGGSRRMLRHHRLQARQDGRARQGRGDRVRPEPDGAHRADPLPRRREALHPGAGRPRGGDDGSGRAGRGDPRRQRAAAAQHAQRHRSCTTSSCSSGRGGQIVRSAGGSAQLMAKEEQVLPAAPAFGRDAARARGLHGDGRPGEQRGARAREAGQGRPHALDGPPAARFAVRR